MRLGRAAQPVIDLFASWLLRFRTSRGRGGLSSLRDFALIVTLLQLKDKRVEGAGRGSGSWRESLIRHVLVLSLLSSS